MGGQGKIFGTLIGAFIIAVIKNGMNLTDVDPFNQKIVLGAVLMIAVLLDTLRRKKGHR
jgi:ribose transport system permease protein